VLHPRSKEESCLLGHANEDRLVPADSPLRSLYAASYPWLFYDEDSLAGRSRRSVGRAPAIRGQERLVFGPSGDGDELGSSLLRLPKVRAGVMSV
jgi:hypothetical protein